MYGAGRWQRKVDVVVTLSICEISVEDIAPASDFALKAPKFDAEDAAERA
jgi:hypothetical protein